MLAGQTGKPKLCTTFAPEGADSLSDSYAANQALWRTLDAHYVTAPTRKIIVFMDGTANDKSDSTNVRKLYLLSVQQACSGQPIIPYYDKGVGAKWFDRVRGGIAGSGTSLNIRQAYRFLVETYKPGDEIYLIGFSRGAFTARSLNGFIEFAGLLKFKSVEPSWLDGILGMSHLHFVVEALYDAYHANFDGTPDFETKLRDALEAVKCHEHVQTFDGPAKVKVTAIGVFDTVPALGILRDDEPDDHRLDLYAQYGYHALSLDEQRDDFRLVRFDPLRTIDGSTLEEAWFAGVHSDIGGSYSKSFACSVEDGFAGLATTPLNWMLKNFEPFGIFPPGKKYTECHDGKLHDEYFSESTGLFQYIGTFPRRPHPGDAIHRSVADRLNIPALRSAHPQREPGNRYSFLGKPLPHGLNAVDFLEGNLKLKIVD